MVSTRVPFRQKLPAVEAEVGSARAGHMVARVRMLDEAKQENGATKNNLQRLTLTNNILCTFCAWTLLTILQLTPFILHAWKFTPQTQM